MSWVSRCVSMLVLLFTRSSFPSLFSHVFVITIFSLSFFCFLPFRFFHFSYFFFFFIMYPNASNAKVSQAVPFSVVEEVPQVANAKVTSDARVTDIEIDRAVPYWPILEYKTNYTVTLDAQRFGERFSDGANLFMLDHRNVPLTRISTLGIKNGQFWGDDVLVRRKMCSGSTFRSFAMQKELVTPSFTKPLAECWCCVRISWSCHLLLWWSYRWVLPWEGQWRSVAWGGDRGSAPTSCAWFSVCRAAKSRKGCDTA